MKKILVTGANGQLGSELQQLSRLYLQYEFIFADRRRLAIEDRLAVAAFFKEYRPDYCINCAAYTAVDKAETERDKADCINGDAVGYLAEACTETGAQLIHISTDYVFDGSATAPIEETAQVKPLGSYGASKLKGEELAQAFAPDSIIIRTSWVYSSFGNNFVKTMLRLMRERRELNVVNDQLGVPTYAADLAKAILNIIDFLEAHMGESNYAGIYHYSNSGIISWYDFAVAIRDLIGAATVINPIPTSAYPTPAQRPAYSAFNTDKIQETFGVNLVPWRDSLQSCLLLLQQYIA